MSTRVGFVTRAADGVHLEADGTRFTIHGGTGYGTYDNPAGSVALAAQLRVNCLELVEFEENFHSLASVQSESTWARVDRNIAAFRNAGKHVILNLSAFAWSLLAAGINPLTYDSGWRTFLNRIAARVNTANGLRYRDDPTIALVLLWGEACYPGESDDRCPASVVQSAGYTTASMLQFFRTAMANWRAAAPNILVASGGFSHLDNDDNPAGVANGIPYQAIYNDANNAVCAVECNSPGDRDIAVPKVRAYAAQIRKPWFLAAWSSCYHSGYWNNGQWADTQMAAHATEMYNLRDGPGQPACGADFWNMQDEGTPDGTCSISPNRFPLTAQIILNRAP